MEDNFTTHYKKHNQRLCAYLANKVRVPHPRVEDIAAESWLRAWRARDRFRGDCAFMTLMCVIGRNVWLMQRRTLAERTTDQLPEFYAGRDNKTPERIYSTAERTRNIPALVLQAYHEGLTMKELSEANGISVGCVKSKLARSRAELRKVLG